jgi:hypothetical protein
MHVAYKHCGLANGLLALFEHPVSQDALDADLNGIKVEVTRNQDDIFLLVAGTHAIPLASEALETISHTKRIVLAASGLFERQITIQQIVEFDDRTLGMLLAYVSFAGTIPTAADSALPLPASG